MAPTGYVCGNERTWLVRCAAASGCCGGKVTRAGLRIWKGTFLIAAAFCGDKQAPCVQCSLESIIGSKSFAGVGPSLRCERLSTLTDPYIRKFPDRVASRRRRLRFR